jgi:hypothetical protein
MAKPVFDGFPKDVPAINSQEVRYREADQPGADKWLSVEPGSTELDRKKGNLGMRNIPDFGPTPLSHAGAPFSGLKGGK